MDHQLLHSNGDMLDDSIRAVPQAALESISGDVEKIGGEWQEAPENVGSVGRTMFDTPASDDGSVTILLPREQIESVPRQSFVRIKSHGDDRSYLGVVVEGPFAEPDGLRADAPILVSVTVRGAGILMPKFHGRVQVEIVGEELKDGTVVPPRRRPLPNSPVFILDRDETASVLQTGGEICLGVTDGLEDIEIRVPLAKAVFPRHIGFLGTTGAGKSTTVSGTVKQLSEAGGAVIILDTEGEYTAINQPTEDPRMQAALARRDKKPSGVQDTQVYYLVGREPKNPNHPHLQPFTLRFSELSPYAVMEIMEFSTAQEQRYLQTYDACKQILRQVGIYPATREEEKEALELDEMDTGYPKMTLSHVIDIASAFLHFVSKAPGDPEFFNAVFTDNLDKIKQQQSVVKGDSSVPSWRALLGKLWRLHRLGIFDNPEAKTVPYAEMLQAGRVSIIDMSDTDSTMVNNLVIAQILHGVQKQQEANYKAAVAQGDSPVPTMVFIEEAHEFLSAQRIKDMDVLFQQVARIARRGRKRWLGLAFVTQLPQHLPDEVLGLINNWVLHKINDSGVVNRLRRSISGIDDGLWDRLPGLAPGQAIVSFTSLGRPLQVTIDPTPCKLLMVE